VLGPSLLGGFVLLFGTAFAAYATAAAMVGSVLPLVTLQIADALSGNVLIGQEGVASALALDMVVVAGLVMAIYLPLQRRSARWLR
jgi:putative spermidine/putrescine transport system permease protein